MVDCHPHRVLFDLFLARNCWNQLPTCCVLEATLWPSKAKHVRRSCKKQETSQLHQLHRNFLNLGMYPQPAILEIYQHLTECGILSYFVCKRSLNFFQIALGILVCHVEVRSSSSSSSDSNSKSWRKSRILNPFIVSSVTITSNEITQSVAVRETEMDEANHWPGKKGWKQTNDTENTRWNPKSAT